MSQLWVTEYNKASRHGGAGPMPEELPLAEQVLDFTAGEVQSSAFNAKTTFVRLQPDAVCHVLFGADPTATTANQRLPANIETFRSFEEGQSLKVSVIGGS